MAVTIVILFWMALLTPSLGNGSVPVLLWKVNMSDLALPDLQELSSTAEEFQLHLILKSIDAETMIVFLLNELNLEDFSAYPDALSTLQREFESSDHVFTPSMSPLAVERLTSYSIATVDVDYSSSVRLANDSSKTLLLVPLQDRPAVNRHTSLQQVDNAIREVLDSVKRLSGSYVAVLTGRYTSIGGDFETRSGRSLKAAVPDKPSNKQPLFLNFGCVLLYTSDSPVIHFQSVTERAGQQALLLPLGVPSFNTSSCDRSDVNMVTIVWQHTNNNSSIDLAGVKLELAFKANMSRPGGSDLSSWTLENVTLTYGGLVDGKPISKAQVTLDFGDIYAPRHFSYHCTSRLWAAEPTINGTDSDGPMMTALQLHGFQVQAFLPPGARARFGRPWDCTTLFTIPILSGLMLSLLMLAILAVSLVMLASIRTNDRFDSPRCEPLLAHLQTE